MIFELKNYVLIGNTGVRFKSNLLSTIGLPLIAIYWVLEVDLEFPHFLMINSTGQELSLGYLKFPVR